MTAVVEINTFLKARKFLKFSKSWEIFEILKKYLQQGLFLVQLKARS